MKNIIQSAATLGKMRCLHMGILISPPSSSRLNSSIKSLTIVLDLGLQLCSTSSFRVKSPATNTCIFRILVRNSLCHQHIQQVVWQTAQSKMFNFHKCLLLLLLYSYPSIEQQSDLEFIIVSCIGKILLSEDHHSSYSPPTRLMLRKLIPPKGSFSLVTLSTALVSVNITISSFYYVY